MSLMEYVRSNSRQANACGNGLTCTARGLESGDRILIKIQPMWHRSTAKNMPTTAAERIRNTRDRKPKRAIYSLFATIIILRNSQKPRDRRIFDRLDMTAQSIVATQRRGVPVIVTLAAMAALAAPTADAAARQSRPAPTTEATAPREAGEPIMAIVSIMSQQVTLYDADGWILRAPVSTGTTGRETPAGVFAIIEKDKDHHSTLYDDAWMPNMQRITWNGIALHGGPLPGHAASHGCVRMPYDFAEKLFDKTWIGMRVIVSPNDAAPVEISHPALFVPNAEAVAAAPTRAETLAREAAEAAKTADEAKKAAATAAREAASLTASLRKLEWLKPRVDAELAFADKALAAAKTDQAKARAEELKQKAAANAAEAGTQLDRAKADAKSKLDAAAAAKDAAKLPRPRRPPPPRRQARRSSRSSRSRFTLAARRRSFTYGVTRISRGRTGVRCSIRPLKFRSRSAIPTSRSARMCSQRWRATTRACAGPRSRSTTGTTPRTRSTASPSRRMCSIASRRLHCRDPRSSSRTSR